MKLKVALGCALLLVVPLGGCKKIAEARKAAEALKALASANKAQGSPDQAGSDSEADKDGQLGEKLGQYIECMNYTSKRVVDSRERYMSWVKDEKVGPTGKERNIYGLYEINTDSCYRSLDKAKTMAPPLPDIDPVAVQYRAALEELLPTIKDAHKYYDQSDYKDDKMAKGKTLHPTLMAGFAKFESVNKTFEERVIKLNDEVGERQMQRMAKDPTRKFQYLETVSMHNAKALIKLAEIDELKELDEAKFDVALQTYERSLTDVETYADTNKAEASKVHMFSIFTSAARDYLKSAKELLRRKRDKKDFNKEFFSNSSPQMVDGHPAQVIDKYNTLINRSNSLNF